MLLCGVVPALSFDSWPREEIEHGKGQSEEHGARYDHVGSGRASACQGVVENENSEGDERHRKKNCESSENSHNENYLLTSAKGRIVALLPAGGPRRGEQLICGRLRPAAPFLR